MHSRPLILLARRVFLALLGAAAFAATMWIMPRLPLRQGLVPTRSVMPDFERPGPPWFYVTANDGELSQRMLFHDVGASIDNARRADILYFGNSRMQLGLRGEVLVPRAREAGLEAFAIGVGHSEKISFALELIRRHDLRPKVFVSCGGPDHFTEGMSEVARRAMESTPWEARRAFLETQGSWAFSSRLHRVLPKLDVIGEKTVPWWIVYRSPRTGWWRTAWEAPFLLPVRRGQELEDYGHTLPLAAELHEEITRRGGLVVFTMVPFWKYRSGHLPYLAEQLDTPYVLGPDKGLVVADREHLVRKSALAYSEAFWERFLAEPRVRRQLGLDAGEAVSVSEPIE